MNSLWNEKDKRLWEKSQEGRIQELYKALSYFSTSLHEEIRLIQFVLYVDDIYGVLSDKYRKQFEKLIDAYDNEEETLTEKLQEIKPWERI